MDEAQGEFSPLPHPPCCPEQDPRHGGCLHVLAVFAGHQLFGLILGLALHIIGYCTTSWGTAKNLDPEKRLGIWEQCYCDTNTPDECESSCSTRSTLGPQLSACHGSLLQSSSRSKLVPSVRDGKLRSSEPGVARRTRIQKPNSCPCPLQTERATQFSRDFRATITWRLVLFATVNPVSRRWV